MPKQILLLLMSLAFQVVLVQAQTPNNYPGRYMGKEEVKTIAAPIDAKTWTALYLNAVTLQEAAKSRGLKMTTGSLEDLKAVMNLFDKFDPAKKFTIPPTGSDF
jgi:hypothetical protein